MQSSGKVDKVVMSELLESRNLSKDMFVRRSSDPTLESDIRDHVKWAFNYIYSIRCPDNKNSKNKIIRLHHGIPHVTYTALYVPVMANLYRKHGNNDANKLTEEDIKLLKIAAIFHDSARKSDLGEDEWDRESATFLYYYLRQILKVDVTKAKLLAEAVANKDWNPNNNVEYNEINEAADGSIIWSINMSKNGEKNIYQKIIHDADWLEIIRAKSPYKAKELDFYKDHGRENEIALNEMAQLVTEVRSLIDIRGDTLGNTNDEIKQKFENENAYQCALNSIDKDRHKVVSTLCHKLMSEQELQRVQLVETTAYDPKLGLTEENLRAAMRDGKLFTRGINVPSADTKKKLKSGNTETFARTDLRKTNRRKNVETTTSKKTERFEKEGNPYRSISMVGYGSRTFSDAGYIIIDPNLDDISEIYSADSDTGHGKKAILIKQNSAISKKSDSEKKSRLKNLNIELKMGGVHKKSDEFVFKHTEILYHVRNYDAIYYSNDPNFEAADPNIPAVNKHPYSSILQAYYLQKEYIKANPNKPPLCIYEYSGTHNFVRKAKADELSESKIMEMWVKMCSDYIASCLKDPLNDKIISMSIDDIKVISMYGGMIHPLTNKFNPADSNYDYEFKRKIDAAIQNEKEKLIKQHEDELIKRIQNDKSCIVTAEVFYNLLHKPSLLEKIREDIKDQIGIEVIKSKPNDISPDGVFKKLCFKDENSYLLSRNELFFQSNKMKILILATKLGLQDNVKDIHNEIVDHVLEFTRNLKNQPEPLKDKQQILPYEYQRLEMIIRYTDFLQIYPNNLDVKEALDKFIDAYTTTYVEKHMSRKFSNFVNYLGFIEYLYEHRLVNEKRNIIIQKTITNFKHIVEMQNESFLIFYLKVVKAANTSDVNINDVFNKWALSHSHMKAYELWVILELRTILDFTDSRIFKLIADHICIYYYPSTSVDIKTWTDNIRIIEKSMPNNEFTSMQKDLLSTRLETIFQNINQTNTNGNYRLEYIKQVYDFLKSEMSFELPASIIRCASDYINNISKDTFNESNGYQLEYFKFVHLMLPNPEERNNFSKMVGLPEHTKTAPNLVATTPPDKTASPLLKHSHFSVPVKNEKDKSIQKLLIGVADFTVTHVESINEAEIESRHEGKRELSAQKTTEEKNMFIESFAPIITLCKSNLDGYLNKPNDFLNSLSEKLDKTIEELRIKKLEALKLQGKSNEETILNHYMKCATALETLHEGIYIVTKNLDHLSSSESGQSASRQSFSTTKK